MNTSSVARAGAGAFSTVLVAVLLLMVGALFVADRALTSASEQQANIDAIDSAHLIEQIVARQVDGLNIFQPLMTGAQRGDNPVFDSLAASFSSTHPAVREIWLADSTGQVVRDSVLIALGVAPVSRELLHNAVAAAAARRTPLVTIGDTRQRGAAVVASPLIVGGRLRGAVAAVYDADSLFAPVLHDPPPTRAALALIQGRDTLVRSSGLARNGTLADRSARVRMGGVDWLVRVEHAQASQRLRVTLWALGLVAVMLLGIGVLRERRQALRVAERSSELERLSSELLRANRMKSEFLANVSHELRTPLNAIVGFVDLLRDGVYGDLSPRQAPPVERIAASATHLRHLVDQVLDIAKMAAGRLEVHAETIVLRPFVLNVASELEPLITERGLNLSIAVGASLPRVRTDPTHLRQILVNLIGNAVKYTTTGGIAVRARLAAAASGPADRRVSPEDPSLLSRSPDRRKTWIALQVVDTGIGIAAGDLERIFDEFEQVNAGPRGDSMERGTGLGLPISRRLARLLGGEITVESQPGKGSTFTIWLPVSPADMQLETPAEPTGAAQGTGA